MGNRDNQKLNIAIEDFIRTWYGTVLETCVKNMYENGDSYEHICEAANIDIVDYEDD